MDTLLTNNRFPRANNYHPAWVTAGVSGGANPLWLAEWLCEDLHLQPGMRILDLGCGRALSSIFLHREFGVEVWAADLWFSPSENLQRIRDAAVEKAVYPLRLEARNLPFAEEFFDAILSIDSFVYYGTDDLYLNYLARFVKPQGAIAIAGAGLTREIEGAGPEHLRAWWEPEMCCLHSAAWWRNHWERTGIVDVDLSDSMPEGWQHWLEWQNIIAPENLPEIRALQADRGDYLGYVRTIARRRAGVRLNEVTSSVGTNYAAFPVTRF